jgi:hypothetical protein
MFAPGGPTFRAPPDAPTCPVATDYLDGLGRRIQSALGVTRRRCSAALLETAPQTLELLARLGVEKVTDPAAGASLLVLAVLLRLELRQKQSRGELSHLLARHPSHRRIRGDEADALVPAVLRSEPLEKVVRMRGVSDGERSDLPLLPPAVEHHEPASPAPRDEARERVHELGVTRKLPRVQEIVAVEEIEARLRHRVVDPSYKL